MSAAVQLGIVCAALVAGETLGFFWSGGAMAWPIVAGVALMVAVFGFARTWRGWHIPFFFLLGLSLAMRADDTQHRSLAEIAMSRGPFEAVFEVTGDSRIGADQTNGLRWVSFPTTCSLGGLNVVFQQSVTNDAPRLGERWHCAGWLERGKPGDYRVQRLWVRGRKTFAERVATADPMSRTVLLARIRRDFSRRLGIGLEDRPVIADLNRAMLLGERAALPWEMREDFVRAGTIHVFAISGLHVMVVAQFFLYVLVVLMVPVRFAGLVLLPVLWIYVLLIGAPPSALRAAAMASVCFIAPIFWRRPDALTAWEVTLIFFAIFDPVGIFGVGSLLSFTVVLGILLFVRWAKPFNSRVLTGFGVPFAAWAAGVPIAAHIFARITPGGLLANLAMVPAAFAAVMASVFGIVTSFVSTRLAAHVNNVAALFTEAMAGISWAVARIPGANLDVSPWPLWVCAAWYAGIVLIFVWIQMVWSRKRGELA